MIQGGKSCQFGLIPLLVSTKRVRILAKETTKGENEKFREDSVINL